MFYDFVPVINRFIFKIIYNSEQYFNWTSDKINKITVDFYRGIIY